MAQRTLPIHPDIERQDRMRHMHAFDRSSRTFDVDGRMHVAACRISKACINPYFGREIPNSEALGLEPNRIYYLYRDPEELAKAASTFANLPLLKKHVVVNADSPGKEIIVGTTGSEIYFDGTYLCTDKLSVWTAEAIALIESGTQEQLSSAYKYRADMTAGVLNGQSYDGVMRDIVGNHVAIVENGRAGSDVHVADQTPTELRVMKWQTRKLLARLAAAGHPALPQEQIVAMDAAMPAGGAWDGWSDEDRTKACDEWCQANGKAMDAMSDDDDEKAWKWAKDKRAKDARPNPAPAPVPGVTREAMDAAIATAVAAATQTARAEAIAANNALHAAREAVRPLIGTVSTIACDSADAVYAFALEQAGVPNVKTTHPSAYPALLQMAITAKNAAQARPVTSRHAMDTAGQESVQQAIGCIAGIRLAH